MKTITDREHLACIMEHSERLTLARLQYLRECGFVNDGDLPWVLSAVAHIMSQQHGLGIDKAVELFIKRCQFYAKTVEARDMAIIAELEPLSAGVDCKHNTEKD